MRRPVLWILAGILPVLAGWTGFRLGVRTHTRDLTDCFPEQTLEALAKALPWMESATMTAAGSYVLAVPSDPTNGSLAILPSAEPRFPILLIGGGDGSNQSRFTWFTARDMGMRDISVFDNDSDGVFDAYAFIRPQSNAFVSVTDMDCDGRFDLRKGPSGQRAIMISNVWTSLECFEQGNMAVSTPLGIKGVRFEKGRWHLLDRGTQQGRTQQTQQGQPSN